VDAPRGRFRARPEGYPRDVTGVIAIVVIAVIVLAIGFVLARKGFVRGTMPEKPSEDKPTTESVGAQDEPGVAADPRAVGKPSERGYEQQLKP
jgi:hypothetical protein